MAAEAYQVEPMRMEDFDQVIELWRHTEGVGLSESDTRSNIGVYLARNPGLSFVARGEGGIVGAVLCGHDGRRGYLHHLAVARDHRRRGLGRRLVQGCLESLAAAGIPKCNISLFDHNQEGESFWRQTGWMARRDLRVMQKTVLQIPAT